MSACEKCWVDSHRDADGDFSDNQPKRYGELIESRRDSPCTPEEQAGPDASKCPQCGRMALHQITGDCMNGCRSALPLRGSYPPYHGQKRVSIW